MIIEVTINGELFIMDSFNLSFKKVEMGDKVTTLDGVTHIEKQMIKRYIIMSKTDIEATELSRLLTNIYSKKYTTVTYRDTMKYIDQTRVFLLQNDVGSSVKIWKKDLEYHESTMIEILEKGAE